MALFPFRAPLGAGGGPFWAPFWAFSFGTPKSIFLGLAWTSFWARFGPVNHNAMGRQAPAKGDLVGSLQSFDVSRIRCCGTTIIKKRERFL